MVFSNLRHATGGLGNRALECRGRAEEGVKVDYVEETTVKKALVFEVEQETVDHEIEAKVREYAKKVKLPGFRPGHVPTSVIKQRFRDRVFGDAAEAIVNRIVFPEIEGRGLKLLAAPKIDDLKIEEGTPMTFRAVFETLPLVELPEYRGLAAKTRKPNVTDADVDQEVERKRQDSARFEPVEGRSSVKGDFVLLDLAWRPTQGGRGGRDENAFIEVGGESNHDVMNAALEGMSPGDTKDVTLEYAADHTSPTLAGKSFRYTLKLKAIKSRVVAELDDELAKDLGEWDTLAAMREGIRKQLLETEERKIDAEVRNALVLALADKATFEVPEVLVEHHMNSRTESTARGLAYRGIDPSKVGVNWRDFREAQRESSVKAAKADILLDEIASREGIEAQPAEVDKEIARLAERLRTSPEALRRQMEKEGELRALHSRIREDKVLDLMKANARLDFE